MLFSNSLVAQDFGNEPPLGDTTLPTRIGSRKKAKAEFGGQYISLSRGGRHGDGTTLVMVGVCIHGPNPLFRAGPLVSQIHYSGRRSAQCKDSQNPPRFQNSSFQFRALQLGKPCRRRNCSRSIERRPRRPSPRDPCSSRRPSSIRHPTTL
jgi:hypothetical protein